MPLFEIEVIEVWTSKVHVDAESMEEAVHICLDGDGEPVDDSTEYMEMDESRGMSEDQMRAKGFTSGHFDGDILPTIRDINIIEE